MEHGGAQRGAAARARRRSARCQGETRRGGVGAGRPLGISRCLSARALGRDEDAGLDRARARHRSAAAADGRAVRRARRDHPLQAQRRAHRLVARRRQHRGVRHPLGVRVGLSVEPHRGDDAAARPRVRRACDRRAVSARRGLSHLARIRRVGAAPYRRRWWRRWHSRRRESGRERSFTGPRRAAPRRQRHQLDAGRAAGGDPRDRRRHLGPRGADRQVATLRAAVAGACRREPRLELAGAVELAAGHADDDVRGARARARRRHRARHPVQPVAAHRDRVLSLCGDPAGDAHRRHRAAAPHLPAAAGGGARLRVDRRVLPGARQHDARAQLGRPQSRRPLRALRRLAVFRAHAPQTALGAALHARWPEDRRRPVADRRRRRGDRGGLGRRRVRARLPHRRVRATASISRACSPR